MKLTELWKTKKKPTVSYELYPARNDKAQAKLEVAITKLVASQPDFISVTFGAGGSTRQGSYQLVEKLLETKSMKVVTYFACYGLSPTDIFSALEAYRDLGIEDVLAVRGDPPHDQPDFQPAADAPLHASDLIGLIKPKFDFCLGAAGYPEGHLEAESKQKDLDYLKLKLDQGAEYVVTNYTYDNRRYFEFVERCRAAGIDQPILPGVMPIYSVKMMHNLAKLCGASIPDRLQKALAALPEGDKDALYAYSVDLAVELCSGLIEGGAPGVHLYTMDRSKAVVEIVGRLREAKLI